MAAPRFIAASTGGTDAAGAWTATCHAPGAAGRLIILQVLQDGTTSNAVTFTSATNIENLAGTDNQWTALDEGGLTVFILGSPTAAWQRLWMGRSLSTSAPTFTGGNSTSEDLYWRFYEFADVAPGTTQAEILEGLASFGLTDATAQDRSVTTLGPDRLALNFVAVNDDNAIGQFSGQTGGEWVEVAEYAESSGTDGAIQLQWAYPGSIGSSFLPSGSADIYGGTGTNEQQAQSFVSGSGGTVTGVYFAYFKTGSPTDDLIVELQTDSGGVPSGTVVGTAGSLAATSAADTPYVVPVSATLSAATTYWLVFRRTGSRDTSNYPRIGASGNTYTSGEWKTRSSGSWSGTGSDLRFHILIGSGSTINGGTASITDSDAWGVVGFALIGTTVGTPFFAANAIIKKTQTGSTTLNAVKAMVPVQVPINAIILRPDHKQPRIVGSITGNSGGNVTTYNMPIPVSGLQPDDLFVAVLGFDGLAATNVDSTTGVIPDGWFLVSNDAPGFGPSSPRILLRRATGSETSPVAIPLSASEAAASVVYRVRDWMVQTLASWIEGFNEVDPRVFISGAEDVGDTSATPNPPSLNLDAAPHAFGLWIGAVAWDGNQAASAYPSELPDDRLTDRVVSSTGAGIAAATWGGGTTQALDPGTFTIGGSLPWTSITFHIHEGDRSLGTITLDAVIKKTQISAPPSPAGAWSVTPNTGTDQWVCVAYGNGLWVAGGNDGAGAGIIAYTTDPTSGWAQYDLSGAANVGNIAYGDDGYWVVVGDTGATGFARRATDPTAGSGAWTTITLETIGLQSVAYGDGTWVISTTGDIWYIVGNPAGTWTKTAIGGALLGNVAYGDGYWVVVTNTASGGFYYTVDPATSWTSQSHAGTLEAVTYGDGYWVIGHSSGLSYRASTPNGSFTSGETFPAYALDIVYAHGYWLAAIGGGSVPHYDTDPTSTAWTTTTIPPPVGPYVDAGADAYGWVVVGDREIAALRQAPASLTADAAIAVDLTTQNGSLTANAVIFKTIAGSFTANAVIKKTIESTYTFGSSASGAATDAGNTTVKRSAQSFIAPITGTLRSFTHDTIQFGSPGDSLVVTVRTDQSGEPSSTVVGTIETVLGSSLPTAFGTPRTITGLSIPLTVGATYWFHWERTGSLSSSDYYRVSASNVGTYTGGLLHYYETFWTPSSGWDVRFSATVSSGPAFDAVVLKTQSGSFTADAIVLKTIAAAFTADAVVYATIAGSFTADAVIKREQVGSFTADASIVITVSGSFAADAVISKTQAASSTADAIAKRTMPAPAASTRVANGSWTDAGSATTVTPTIPGGGQAGDLMLAYVASRNPATASSPGWAYVGGASSSGGGNNQTINVLAKIHSGSESNPTFTRSAGGDRVVAKIDIWRAAAGWGYDYSSFATAGSGADLSTLTGSEDIELSAGDVMICAATCEREVVDPSLGWSAIDATGITWAAGVQTGTEYNTSTIEAEAVYRVVASGTSSAAPTLTWTEGHLRPAAIWFRLRAIPGFSASAVVKREQAASFAANAAIKREQAASFTTDAVIKAPESGSFASDAILWKTIASALTASAVISKGFAASIPADAVILRAQSGSLTANSVLLKTQAATFTLDAEIVVGGATVEGSFTADAIVKREATASSTADAIIRAEATAQLVADAVLSRTQSGSFTANAIITKTIVRGFVQRTNDGGGFGINEAVYANGWWVAVGAGGNILATQDHTGHWADAASQPIGTNTWAGVATDGTLFAALGASSSTDMVIATATDPSGTWTTRSDPYSGTLTANFIGYFDGYWVTACGSQWAYTTDPISVAWTLGSVSSGWGGRQINSIYTYDGAVWLMAGDDNRLAYTTDLTGSWTDLTVDFGTVLTDVEAVTSDGTTWVAVGDGRTAYATDPTGAWTMAGPTGWDNSPLSVVLRSVATDGTLWYAVGQATGGVQYAVATTTPTGPWYRQSIPETGNNNYQSVRYVPAVDVWVVTGSGGRISTTEEPIGLVLSAAVFSQRTGSRTANAVIKATTTASFTADAFIQPYFRLDAALSVSVPIDAVVLRTGTGSLTVDAWVAGSGVAAFSADATTLAVRAGQYAADAVIEREAQGSGTAEAVVLATMAAVLQADAAIWKTASGAFALDAVLLRTQAGDELLDAVIAATHLASFTADAVLVRPQTGSLSVDAVVQRPQDGSLQTEAVLKATRSGTYQADAVVLATRSGQGSVDAVLLAGQQGQFDLDAVIGETSAGDFTNDATILRTQLGSVGVDADILAVVTGQYSLQAVIAGIFRLDAVVLAHQDSSFSASAVIAGIWRADAVILAHRGATYTLDAFIGGVGVAAFSLDAVIEETENGSFALDAVVSELIEGAFSVSAAVAASLSASMTADAVVLAGVSSSGTLDAYIVGAGAVTASFSADAVIFVTASATIAASAVIAWTESASFTLSALLKTVGQASFETDAVIEATRTGGVATDAVFLSPRLDDFGVDAYLSLSVGGGSSPLDAVLLALRTGSLAADATFRSVRSGAFSLDASLTVVPVGSFTADAVIAAFIPPQAFTLDAALAAVGQDAVTVDASITRHIPLRIEADFSAATIAGDATADTLEATTSAATIAFRWVIQSSKSGGFTLSSEVSDA